MFWLSRKGDNTANLGVDLPDLEGFEFRWDPLDLDTVFAIIGVVLLAISQTLERAWLAEDETEHPLRSGRPCKTVDVIVGYVFAQTNP